MVSAREMRWLALALSLYHVSAFAGVPVTRAVGLEQQRLDQGVANAVFRRRDFQDQEGVVRRARGGAQVWRRKAVALPVEISDKVDEKLIIETPPSPEEKKGLLNAYMRCLDRRPLPTKIVTSGIICGIGDILAQALSFKTAAAESVTLGGFAAALEFQRFGIYTLLGAFWIAPVVHYWFDALESFTKSKNGPPKTFAGKMLKALKMVAMDQSIGAPLVNSGMMFFFAFLASTLNTGAVGSSLREALSSVRNKLWGTMLVCWKLWPVANLLNFAFVPPHLRVLFMNFVGLGWNIYLAGAVN